MPDASREKVLLQRGKELIVDCAVLGCRELELDVDVDCRPSDTLSVGSRASSSLNLLARSGFGVCRTLVLNSGRRGLEIRDPSKGLEGVDNETQRALRDGRTC
jgi:hypothetical protein